MEHTLPPLPYPHDALAPHMSRETLEYHHDKHHNAYVVNLNNLQKGTEFESMGLEDIIKKSSGGIYNNAAHELFGWACLSLSALLIDACAAWCLRCQRSVDMSKGCGVCPLTLERHSRRHSPTTTERNCAASHLAGSLSSATTLPPTSKFGVRLVRESGQGVFRHASHPARRWPGEGM